MLRRQLLETPPTDPHRTRDLSSTFKLGRHILERDDAVQRDIHELFTRSASDLLDHWFETDAVVGNDASPYTPGSGHVVLHHVCGEKNGNAPYGNLARFHRGITNSSTLNTTLATKAAHVASPYCQHFSYKHPGGRNRHQERERAADLIFSTVESYAPDFRASVVGHSALSPWISKRNSA